MGFEYANSTLVTVEDLKPYTNHTYHVTCYGEEFAFFLTDFTDFETLQGPPSLPPAGFEVTLLPGNLSVDISFLPVPEPGRNGNITGYKCEMIKKDFDAKKTASTGWWTMRAEPYRLEYVLDNPPRQQEFAATKHLTRLTFTTLSYFQPWAFRCAGVTIGGRGVFTREKMVRLLDDVPVGEVSFYDFHGSSFSKCSTRR